ncbi:spermidine synthase [Haloechinothrix sp. LS1_15]|uniref:spermidine synthase n=1 Tax=Haloechinothrix sp. LS1_15 TaxID=2652248 RepID=UPI0029481B62|nr:spermidine synthase [Haloechinothrix sp. LS1_15]MDV6011943.1 spermidine synthase [Haloechinothrix sp. LS1_15]
MSARFRELAWSSTPLGELVLRRRWDPAVETEVYEIKLDDEFLMSSLFTVAEEEIARRALAELDRTHPETPLDVAVGGLGLGYTARQVLAAPRVRSLVVIEALGEVIAWHRDRLVPAGAGLADDARCRLLHGDFFAMLRSPAGLDPEEPGRRFHAVVVDIDHSPRHLLDPSHGDFYRPDGLRALAGHLHPGGVFTLWSNDPPDEEFTTALRHCFDTARAEVVRFPNPLQRREATATVYLATVASGDPDR